MKYKVLMHGHVMVDENLLSKGIYETNRPTLHPCNIILQDLVNSYKQSWYQATSTHLSEEYLNNINSCQLIEYDLVNTNLIEALKDYTVLLGKEIDDLLGIAYVHGWKSNNVEEGVRLRELIQQLSK